MDFFLDTCGRRRYLLVMQLFVWKAAADCPKPQTGVNIILTNEALLMNDFPEGSRVTLQCANGLVEESGSTSINCTGGQWTEPDLKCKKKDCGPPKPQPHMSFIIRDGTLFGAKITVMCDKGFQISGAGYKHCYASGWGGKSKCEIVTCELPAEVTHGRSLWDSDDDPQYGDSIDFVCNEGYTLVGNSSIMCSDSGEFDSEPPECRRVTAEDRIAPNTLTPPPASPAQVSTSTESWTISAVHRDKSVTTSTTATGSPKAQGDRDSWTASTARASTTTSSFKDKQDAGVNTYRDTGSTPVIVSVVCVTAVAIILVFSIHKFLQRRKGSMNGTVAIS